MIIVLMQETRIDMRGTPSSVWLGLSGILIARSPSTGICKRLLLS